VEFGLVNLRSENPGTILTQYYMGSDGPSSSHRKALTANCDWHEEASQLSLAKLAQLKIPGALH